MPRSNYSLQKSKSTPTTPSLRPSIPTTFTPPAAPTFFQSVKEGFALGTGASIARNVVDSFMGSRPAQHPTTPAPPQPVQPIDSCQKFISALDVCLKTRHFEEACSQEMSEYVQCRQAATS